MAETRQERLDRLARQYADARRRLENKGHLEPSTNYTQPPILTPKYSRAMRTNIERNRQRIATSTNPVEYLKLPYWKSNAYDIRRLFSRSSRPHTAAAAEEEAKAAKAAARAAQIQENALKFKNLVEKGKKDEAARRAKEDERARLRKKQEGKPVLYDGGRRLTRSKRRTAGTRRKSRQ